MKKHKQYVVRSLGSGRGFGVLDTKRNMFITTGSFSTRAEAYSYIAELTQKTEAHL
jgi:hypothetical protein